MFEKDIDSLLRQLFALLERIKKGEQMLIGIDDESEEFKDYIKQLKKLKVQAFRADACIDILQGDVILIGEQSGTLVIARENDEKAKALAELVPDMPGGFITHVDILEKE